MRCYRMVEQMIHKILKISSLVLLAAYSYKNLHLTAKFLDFDRLVKITDESANIKMIGGIIVKSTSLSNVISNVKISQITISKTTLNHSQTPLETTKKEMIWLR